MSFKFSQPPNSGPLPNIIYEMEIHQQSEVFIERDGDLVFDFTKLILRGQNDDYYYAIVKDRIGGASSTFDVETLQKIPIPTNDIWPYFSAQMSQAPNHPSSECYIKEPNLLDYGDTLASLQLSKLTLHEIEVCELLKKHPHRNVAQYLGCVVSGGRIRGLCFVKYKLTLRKRLQAATPLNKDLCLQGIENGIRHLHSLNIVHNDINPMNIMIDDMDQPILIDFDSCQRQGQKLGIKAGTRGWSIEGSEYALFENDFFGLSRLREHMFGS